MMTKKFSPQVAILKQFMILPLLAGLILIFSTKLVAQDSPKTILLPPPTIDKSKKDTTRPYVWVGLTPGYTIEGVSQKVLEEYEALVDKIKSSGRGLESISKEERQRMVSIYTKMSLEQQNKQSMGFIKPSKPLPKIVPTKEQFEKFKNPGVYGVWINEKKVPNSELNQYKNTDFSQVFISKLYGAAKEGRTYTHQLDLMTNSYYAKYLEDARLHADETIMVFKDGLTIINRKGR